MKSLYYAIRFLLLMPKAIVFYRRNRRQGQELLGLLEGHTYEEKVLGITKFLKTGVPDPDELLTDVLLLCATGKLKYMWKFYSYDSPRNLMRLIIRETQERAFRLHYPSQAKLGDGENT
jgi:hypothetical protein